MVDITDIKKDLPYTYNDKWIELLVAEFGDSNIATAKQGSEKF